MTFVPGTSLAVQWLGLCASNTRGSDLIPRQGSKILHAAWNGKKKKKKVCPLCLVFTLIPGNPWFSWKPSGESFFNFGEEELFLRKRQWHPTPVLLPGKSHGRRSLVGCSPWGCEESDRTEWLHFDFSLSCIGEGNGIPLQYSCLENPRDGGAWWAAVYEVAQSRTRLKRLSSKDDKVEGLSFYVVFIIVSYGCSKQQSETIWFKLKKRGCAHYR